MATTFSRAPRRHALRRMGDIVRRDRRPRTLLPLDEAERRLRPFNRAYVGVRSIPVDQIVGTDGRGADFDREFSPRRPGVAERRRRVDETFAQVPFPPIVAYKLGDAYFVIDGHHRVAVARQRKMAVMDAEVTELKARWHLPPDADLVDLIHAEQERVFMDESGLGLARPEARIRFGSPGGYIELLENVQINGYHLMLEAGRALPPEQMAAAWYERVYRPAVEAVHADGLLELYPDATEADLFLHLYQRRRQLYPDCGCPPLEQTARQVVEERERRRGPLGRIRVRR